MDAIDSANSILADVVSGLLAAARAFGFTAVATARGGIAAAQETPSAQDTVSIIRSAVAIIQQLWPEPQPDRPAPRRAGFPRDEEEEAALAAAEEEAAAERARAAHDAGVQAVQAVLFDSAHELLRLLWLFVAPPRNPWIAGTSAPPSAATSAAASADATDVKAAAFRAVKALGMLCARDESLAFMFTEMLRAERGVASITRCLCSAASTNEARSAAAELLIVLTLQLGVTAVKVPPASLSYASATQQQAVAHAAAEQEDALDVALLISTTLAEPQEQIRSFVLAAVQCCIVQQQQQQQQGSSDDSTGGLATIASLCTTSIVSALLRLVSSDDSCDVRCVAALALHALLSVVPVAVISVVAKRMHHGSSNSGGVNGVASPTISLTPVDYIAVAEACVGRLLLLLSPVNTAAFALDIESAPSPSSALFGGRNGGGGAAVDEVEEEVSAVVQLLESAVQAAAVVGNEQVFVALRQRSIARSVVLRSAANAQRYRPAVLLQLLRCVRVMLERSPPFASQSPQMCDATTLAALFKLTLSFGNVGADFADASVGAAAAETQLVLGFVLTFSAETRAQAVADLSQTMPMFAGVLRDRSLSQLQAVDPAYFFGIELRDEYHALLNDDTLQSLRWNKRDGSLDPDCARMILDGQQLRAMPTGRAAAATGAANNSSSNLVVNNRPEMTEHWRHCTMQALVATPRHALQRRVSVLVAIVRFVVQSVLRALADAGIQQQQIAKEAAMLRASANSTLGSGGGGNNPIASPSAGRGLTSTLRALDMSALSNGGSGAGDLVSQMLQLTADEEVADRRAKQTDPNDVFVSDQSPSTPTRAKLSPARFLSGAAAAAPALSSMRLSKSQQGSAGDNAASKILQRVNTSLYSEFDACIRIVLHFAEHFKKEAQYTGSNRGKPLVNRPASSSGSGGKLQNPWERNAKLAQSYDPRAWSIDAVQEGDLFYFSLQVASLNATVLEAIVAKARAHYVELKKVLTVTPNAALNRRHFLLEMVSTVMPHTMALLQKLHRMVATQGEGHVQTALALCPELAAQQPAAAAASSSSSMRGGGNGNGSSADQKTIDCGNVVPVVDFLLQYFAPKLYAMGVQAAKPTPSQLLQQQKQAQQQQAQSQQQQQQQMAPQQQSAVGGGGGGGGLSAADFNNFSFAAPPGMDD